MDYDLITMEKRYTIIIEPGEDGWFVVTVPALPGCITPGRTMEEAEENAKEAIAAYIESFIKHRKRIPGEHQGNSGRNITRNNKATAPPCP